MTDHETPQRRIVCAAMRNAWNSVICSPRHWDDTARRLVLYRPDMWRDSAEQGFVDQQGVFLTREEAWPIALAAGQIIRRVGGDEGRLFSENMY